MMNRPTDDLPPVPRLDHGVSTLRERVERLEGLADRLVGLPPPTSKNEQVGAHLNPVPSSVAQSLRETCLELEVLEVRIATAISRIESSF